MTHKHAFELSPVNILFSEIIFLSKTLILRTNKHVTMIVQSLKSQVLK